MLEKGEGERSISELTTLCSSFSPLEDLLKKNVLCKQEKLFVLKDADLIWDTREGKFIFYELNTSVLEEIMLWLTDLKGGAAP